MKAFPRGAKVIFTARTGKKFPGIVKGFPATDKISVLLGDDPFPVEVGVDKLILQEYIDTMTTTTKAKTTKATTSKRSAKAAAPTTRTRRSKAAVAEAIDEGEDEAVVATPAKRSRKAAAAPAKATAKKASAKTAKAAKVAEGDNPYRPGSNLYKITEALLKGGKRSAIVARLQRVIDMHPYTQDKDALDVEKELDKRVMLTAGLLERNFNYKVEKEGRGMETGTIKVVPPAA